MNFRALIPTTLLLASVLVSCSTHRQVEIEFSPTPSVTPEQSLAIAKAYYEHTWRPTEANAFHGDDAEGIRVDTPDIAYTDPGAIRPGWWEPNRKNVGIPYMWGGFDTPESFDAKVSRGFYAGDIYSQHKRDRLDDAVSKQTCGIDCSGFVSRCWRLDRSYSTRELPSLCIPLDSFDDLRPGDLVNKRNVHALLFVRFTDENKTHFLAYETGSPPSWKVLFHPIEVEYVRGLGYSPYRYRGMQQ